jgi:hypothetical protein
MYKLVEAGTGWTATNAKHMLVIEVLEGLCSLHFVTITVWLVLFEEVLIAVIVK